MERPLLSIIIPTLNEVDNLPSLLADLRGQQGIASEIIVADGGSTDGTRSRAREFGVAVVASDPGRGRQMNAAAGTATGDLLLFLHADSRLAARDLIATAVQTLSREIERYGDVAGHFRLRFIRTGGTNDLAFRYLEGKSALNRSGTFNGDQGLLLHRDFFRRLGGFDESLPFFEDQRLAAQIRARGVLVTLPGELRTSARRFEREGFHRRYLLLSMMMGLYHAGVPEFLCRAPGIYRVQQETGRLRLTPFFGIVFTMMRREWRLRGTVAVFYRLGRYIRQNSWQLFYFFDLLTTPAAGRQRYPLLGFHDRFVAPLTDWRLLDALTGLGCFIWYLGVLAPYFRLRDLDAPSGAAAAS